MKKVISILLILCLCFSVVGCEKEKKVETVVALNSEDKMQGMASHAIQFWRNNYFKILFRDLDLDLDDDYLTLNSYYFKYDLDEKNATTQSVYGVCFIAPDYYDSKMRRQSRSAFEKYMSNTSWEELEDYDTVYIDTENSILGYTSFEYYKFRLHLHYLPDGEFDYFFFAIGQREMKITTYYDGLNWTDQVNHKSGLVEGSGLYLLVMDSKKTIEE